MTIAHCCICDKLTSTIDAETASYVGYVGEPLCDDCSRLPDSELSRRYDLNHKNKKANCDHEFKPAEAISDFTLFTCVKCGAKKVFSPAK